MRKLLIGLVSGVSLFASVTSMALTAQQSVQKELIVKNADGTTNTTYVPADMVTPGETILYSLNIFNDKNEAATDLVLTMPVPAEVKYVDGSAIRPDANVTFSVDDGKTFSPRNSLQVLQDNGVARPALAEDVTHVRWNLAGPVQIGSSDVLSFKGILK